MDKIMLSCGNGGRENAALIENVFLKYFKEFSEFHFEDAGIFSAQNSQNFVTSVDSYTISPIFFLGGDIGKLSICGSCNDVAVMGAKPRFISISFIIEEGFLVRDLEKIAQSMAHEMALLGLKLLSADTKVVPKGALNGIFITSSVIGERKKNVSAKNLQNGDAIILNAPIGAHGACIYCMRNDINISNKLQSDCANLWSLIESLIDAKLEIHAIRDATRGGIASLLNEWARASDCEIHINESEILIPQEVRGVCEILGLEAYSLANEGVCAIALPKNIAPRALEIMHKNPLGKNAKIIGEVKKTAHGGKDSDLDSNYGAQKNNKKVILHNDFGAARYLEYPEGEILPRIC